jgi:Spy/CpxP family protein refolding chaperone
MFKRSVATILTGLIVSCSLLLLTGPALAERGQRGQRGFDPEKMLEKMSTHLDLTTEQQAQVKAILESHKPQFEQLRDQMRSTLTEEQRANLKEMRKNRKAGGERPSKEERRAKLAEMGVSEEQMQQMRSVREQMKAERKLVKNEISAVLTPEQQAKLEELRAKRKGRRGQRGMRGERGEN